MNATTLRKIERAIEFSAARDQCAIEDRAKDMRQLVRRLTNYIEDINRDLERMEQGEDAVRGWANFLDGAARDAIETAARLREIYDKRDRMAYLQQLLDEPETTETN